MPDASFSFKERTSPTTGRTLEFYRQFLGFEPGEFDGKSVLNIAAGTSSIGTELERQGVKPSLLVNLDLAYQNTGNKAVNPFNLFGKALSRRDIPKTPVAADAKKLPFIDNSFDELLCLWGAWFDNKRFPAFIGETYRTLKSDGKIRIYPVSISPEGLSLIANKYPFVSHATPQIDVPRLVNQGILNTGDAPIKTLIRSSFFIPKLVTETALYFYAKIKNKKAGVLRVAKTEKITQEEVENAMQDLIEHGLEF